MLIVASPSLRTTNRPWRGVVTSRDLFKILGQHPYQQWLKMELSNLVR